MSKRTKTKTQLIIFVIFIGVVTADQNCFLPGPNGCQACINQYIANPQGVCVRADPNCLDFSGDKCVKCFVDYFINSYGGCSKFYDKNCLEYFRSGSCIKCIHGYYPSGNKCHFNAQKKDIRCKKYSGTYCIQCIEWSVRDSKTGMCKPVDPDCKSYQKYSGLCSSCYEPSQLVRGACVWP